MSQLASVHCTHVSSKYCCTQSKCHPRVLPVIVGYNAAGQVDVVAPDLGGEVRADDAAVERVGDVEDVAVAEAHLAVLGVLVGEVRAHVERVARATRRHQLLVLCRSVCG